MESNRASTPLHQPQLLRIYPGSRYIWSAILEEDPYPMKAVFLQTSNPLTVLGNAKRIYEALKSPNLELFVCMDRWMTPSAQLADYVLPAADALERDLLGDSWGFSNTYFAREKAVEPLYERREDYYLWRDLGMRLGQDGYWPQTTERWFDKILESAKVTCQGAGGKGCARAYPDHRVCASVTIRASRRKGLCHVLGQGGTRLKRLRETGV